MNLLTKLFNRKAKETKVGGMEDYMSLVRVYFQASIAAQVGITNLAMFPDLRMFKTTLHVPTQGNKLGVGEKAHCRKMMKEIYHTDDSFFKEIDQSIRHNCKRITDVQAYLIQFQNFTQDLMMLTGNLMKFKLRVPSIFKKTIYAMTERTVGDIFMKNDFKDPSVIKSVMNVRKYNTRLSFSQKWITDFIYQVVMLAKKEPAPSKEEAEAAEKKLGKE
jgi:hypothetical protein